MFSLFTEKDFDAYAAHKWRSNAFNRERLEVKEKLLELGRALTGALTAADGSPLACEATSEHPALWNQKQVDSQHLLFCRNEAARRELDRIIDRSRPLAALIEDPSPQRSHLVLALSVYHDRLATALALHADAAVDRDNLEAKLREPEQHARFLALARGLGDRFRIGVDGADAVCCDALAADDIDRLLAALSRPAPPHGGRRLTIARDIPRADALALGDDITDELRGALVALLPLYQFIAWTRQNDFVSIRDQLRAESVARKQKGIAKSDEVRIVRGMFAGRVGVVQEIDAKGGVKVLVGKMPIKVHADEIEKR